MAELSERGVATTCSLLGWTIQFTTRSTERRAGDHCLTHPALGGKNVRSLTELRRCVLDHAAPDALCAAASEAAQAGPAMDTAAEAAATGAPADEGRSLTWPSRSRAVVDGPVDGGAAADVALEQEEASKHAGRWRRRRRKKSRMSWQQRPQ